MTEITINLKKILKNWALLALIIIFLFSFYIRTSNFHYDYLLNIDSYWQYRYMKYIVEQKVPELELNTSSGLIVADFEKQETKIDSLMEAPNGRFLALSFYHYLGAYSYLFFRLFFSNLELWQFLVYFPAILASLAAIPAYYLGKLIYDKKAGILTAFFIVFNPAIFARSLGGDPDTDTIVILLPLIIMALFFFAYKNISKGTIKKILPNTKVILFSVLTGVALVILVHTWSHWHIFYLITGFVIFRILIEFIITALKRDSLKNSFYKALPLIFSYFIFLTTIILLTLPTHGPNFIFSTIYAPVSAVTELKAEVGENPNVYVSVAEMMTGGDIKDIAQRTGVAFFFLTFVCCLPYLIGTYIKKQKHLSTMILILLWILGPLYASMVAVRFTILLAVPLCLASGIILSKAWRMILGEDKELFE